MRRTALLPVFCLPAAICAAWTVLAGKDVNWDLLNYHYYLPFELLAGRLEQDFFAASAQSYLNPVGYLPFYLMVSSGWHSVAASMTLAVAHSLTIALLYLVAWRLFAHLPQFDRAILSCLATALGAATSVFWATVGSSFLDPLLAAPMLAGLLLLLDGERHVVRRAVLAGTLFGAAAALKYSNAIFALAALPLVLAMPGLTGASRLRAGLGYMAGGTLAVGVLAGPWFVLLAREFGNPVFPLMNGWFQSPHALPVNMIGARFTPMDLGAALAFPFRMIVLDRAVYSEMFAPDIRLAALLVAAVALSALRAKRGASQAKGLRGTDWRVLAFFAAGLLLWLATSANARYGMVVLLLAGVCLARLAEGLLPLGASRVVLAVLLAAQVGMLVMGSSSRWSVAEPWSRRWLPYAVPERAVRDSALYLSVEVLPMAVVAPFLHPASSFVNFRGQHSIPTGSPRLAALLERHRGRVRTFGRGLQLVDGKRREDAVKFYDDTLIRIGYRVDTEDCFTIAWQREEDDGLSRAANWLAGGERTLQEPMVSVASCALRTATRDSADIEAEAHISVLFDRMEKACPRLFRGQTAVTERLDSGWSRNYSGLDARLQTHDGRATLFRYRAVVY
ncbi:MAG TPA: hypothetical protein VMN03_16970, partial [Burkholderiales bacterium]|nr:hypothetical protein [Burkholderiales bacterium]